MLLPIIVLDTETATARGTPHLLELAGIRVVEGEITERFESLVRPQVPIDADASAVHGIADADVREAPDAAQVLTRFSDWLASSGGSGVWMAAHNARFDAHVLAFEYTRTGLPMPDGFLLDTLGLARRALPDAPDHKLETLCQHLAIDVDVRHRALPDAVSCWQVLEACCAELARSEPTADLRWPALQTHSGAPITFASAAPRPARLSARLRPLEEACRSNRRVTLVYGEATNLARLDVSPRFLFQHDKKSYLEAECARSGLLKTYRLDRVHQVQS